MSQQQEITINIFVDFHTNDENIAKDLLTHLSALKYQFNIKIWHHGMIRAGQRRDVLQAAELGEADIILLLMSAAYLNSDSFKTYEKEFSRLSQSGAATLIPILATTSMWQYSDIGRLGLQALPKDDTAIISSRNKSQIYTEIVQALIPVVENKVEEKPKQQAKFEKELEEKIRQTQTKQEKSFDKKQTDTNSNKNKAQSKEKVSFQDYIKGLIAENEVKQAFEEIDKVLKYSNDEKLKGYFALFKSRYYRAENDMMMGKITSENMYVEQTRTLEALMASLDRIPEGVSQQGKESSAVYLDSIIKVSEDKPKDSITNNGKGNFNFQNIRDISGNININMGNKEKSNKEKEEKKKHKIAKRKEQETQIKTLQINIDILKEQLKQDINKHTDLQSKYDGLNDRFSVFQETKHSMKRKAQIQELENIGNEFDSLLKEIKQKEISFLEESIKDKLNKIQNKNDIQEFEDLYQETQSIVHFYNISKKNKTELSKIENDAKHLLKKVVEAYLIREKQKEVREINKAIRHLETDFKTLVEKEKLQAFEKEHEQLDKQLATVAKMDYDVAIQQYNDIKKYWQELPNELTENLKLREAIKKIEQKEQDIKLYFKDEEKLEIQADSKKITQIKIFYKNNIETDGFLNNKNKNLERIKKEFNYLLERILPKEIELKVHEINTTLEKIEKDLDSLQKRMRIPYQNENLDVKFNEIEKIEIILKSYFEKEIRNQKEKSINEINNEYNLLCQKHSELSSIKNEFDDLIQKIQSKEVELKTISLKSIIQYLKEQILHKMCEKINNKYNENNKNYTEKKLDIYAYHAKLGETKIELKKLQVNISKVAENLEQETVSLNEAKLIFIGNGGVGKTTLRENLIDKKYRLKKHDSTNTLEVIEWKMDVRDFDYLEELENIENFTFNIWDFGGQGKYRAIQQFFCTPKALYIFVTTPKERNNLASDDYIGFEYWLSFVNTLSYDKEKKKKSPIIYVLNKNDQKGSKAINEVDIENKFPNVKKFEKVSCKTGRGLPNLKQSIAECLNETDMINQFFSKKWIAVKDELENLKMQGEKFIKYEKFIKLFEEKVGLEKNELDVEVEKITNKSKIQLKKELKKTTANFKCNTINIENLFEDKKELAKRILIERDANALLNYLIYIGEVLHYTTFELKNLLILEPNWGRKLASQALSSNAIINGFFDENDIDKIWNDETKKDAIPLLKNYGLCYEIKMNGERKFVIPALFPEIEPEDFLNFDGEKDTIKCEFEFKPFIPADLLAQLTVKKFEQIWKQNRYWKNGVVFAYEETLAIVTNHWQENKLRIVIKGEKWEIALNDLSDAIQNLTNDLKEILKLEQLDYEKYTFIDGKEVILEENDNTAKKEVAIFESKDKEIKVRKKVKILYISACPDDEVDTRISNELKALKKGIEKSKQEVEQGFPETQIIANDLFNILERDINNNTYLHISVHGYIDYLSFVNKANKLAKINLFDIDNYFNKLTTKPKIVLFSACNSYEFAETTAKYVTFTIGTTGAIPIKAANLLTEHFYARIINNGFYHVIFAFEHAVRCIERAKAELGKHYNSSLNEKIDAYLMPQLYINKKLVKQVYPNFLVNCTDKIKKNKQIHII